MFFIGEQLYCDCGGEAHYEGTAMKNFHGYHVYKCEFCNADYEREVCLTDRSKCAHEWYFDRYGFFKGYHMGTHRIWMVMKCNICGMETKKDDVRIDMGAIGRERVDIEDPRILRFLEVNEDSAEFHLGRDDAKEFWGL